MQALVIKNGFFDKSFEVKSDDQTVWINHHERCVARFSENDIQVGVTDFDQPIYERSNSSRPKQPIGILEWKQFQRLMTDCFGFVLEDEWTPHWMKKNTVSDVQLPTS